MQVITSTCNQTLYLTLYQMSSHEFRDFNAQPTMWKTMMVEVAQIRMMPVSPDPIRP